MQICFTVKTFHNEHSGPPAAVFQAVQARTEALNLKDTMVRHYTMAAFSAYLMSFTRARAHLLFWNRLQEINIFTHLTTITNSGHNINMHDSSISFEQVAIHRWRYSLCWYSLCCSNITFWLMIAPPTNWWTGGQIDGTPIEQKFVRERRTLFFIKVELFPTNFSQHNYFNITWKWHLWCMIAS